MVLSARLRLRSAKRCEACSRLVWWVITSLSAMAFQVFQMGGAQNLAMVVWSAVRVTLMSWPRLCTWLMAAAHAGLDKAGGGGGRNWLPVSSTQGVTSP